MFTGIITHQGTFEKRDGNAFVFAAPRTFVQKLQTGSSVAVNGVCLTVTEKSKSSFTPHHNAPFLSMGFTHAPRAGAGFTVEMMPETVAKTMFADISPHETVNLELSMSASGRFDGHIVQGHVDGVAEVVDIKKQDRKSWLFVFKLARLLMANIVPKGSVAINGVSLTVVAVGDDWFSVGIIPYTFAHTNFGKLHRFDRVNIETDIIARYVKRFLNTKTKETS